MHEDVGVKLFKDEFSNAMLEQQGVNEILCAENCVARWLWKTGQLSSNGYAVPWEV